MFPRISRAVRDLIPKKLRSAVLHRVGPIESMVSVVVPVYNVEAYLGECLQSILDQTYENLEIIVIDDGATDSSHRIAARYARRDPRVRVFRQRNAGLGAARNAGMKRVRGAFVTFVDSDDSLPTDAIENLMRPMRNRRVDLSVGGLTRFNSGRTWVPEWNTRVHSAPRRISSINEHLPLVRNNYTVDKVYRRSFLERTNASFREGVPYEDQPLITRLFLAARGIAVVPQSVYNYRARDDRSSISQQTHTVADLRARISAWGETVSVLAAARNDEVAYEWYRTVFETHVHWYLNNGAATQAREYWSELSAAVGDLLDTAPQGVLGAVSPSRVVALGLLVADRRDDLAEFRLDGGYSKGRFALHRVDDQWRLLDLPERYRSPLAAEYSNMPEDRLRVHHQVRSAVWSQGDDPVLTIRAYCYLEDVDTRHNQPHHMLELKDVQGRTVVSVIGSPSVDEDLIPGEKPRAASYAQAGVVFSVPFSRLSTALEGRSKRELDAYFTLAYGDFETSVRVSDVYRASNANRLPVALSNHVKADANFGPRGLTVRLHRVAHVVRNMVVDEGSFVLTIASVGPELEALMISHKQDGEAIPCELLSRDPEGQVSIWRVRPDRSDRGVPSRRRVYEVRGRDQQGSLRPVAHFEAGGTSTVSGSFRARASERGNLILVREACRAIVESVAFADDGTILLELRLVADGGVGTLEAQFKGRSQETRTATAAVDINGTQRVELSSELASAGESPLPRRSSLTLVVRAGENDAVPGRDIPVVNSQAVRDQLPIRRHFGRSLLVLTPTPTNRLLLSVYSHPVSTGPK